jgi:hypothetical protein
MKNGIKFSAAETGALRIGGANLAPTPAAVANPVSYWTSVEANSCGYTIYLDKNTNGPAIYTANSDAALIGLTNYIANQTYTTVIECLDYFDGQSDKFVINTEYPEIITKQFLLNLDAGFIPSYPRNGTAWKDLSGNNNNATLINGPLFNSSNKDSIVFDGVNDYAQTGSVTSFGTGPFSISMWFKPDGTQAANASLVCVANTASASNWQLSFTSNTLVFWINATTSITTTYVPTDEWTNVVVVRNSTGTEGLKIYINGLLEITSTASTDFTDASGIRIGMDRASTGFFKGEIGNIFIYNRALTEVEILHNYTVTKKIPTYLVRFFDIDGTILKEQFVDQGNDATAPDDPDIDPTYLVFAEWNQPFTNVQSDLDVGAMYDTVDGKTYIFARITDTTGLQPTLDLNKTTADTLTVDWGDNTTNTTSTNGNQTVQKTAAYAAIGDYVISIDCAGGYRNRDGNSLLNTQPYRSSILKVYMGSTMSIQSGCFSSLISMSSVAMNKAAYNSNYTKIFENCYSLKHINFPTSTSVGTSTNFVGNCFSLKNISLPVLNTSVTFSDNNVFNGCRVLQSIVWKNIIITGTACFQNCRGLQGNVVLNSSNTSIPAATFQNCFAIDSVTMLGNITSVGDSAFRECFSLRELEFPASLTSIAANAFNNCFAIQEYTFLSTTPPTLANNAFSGQFSTLNAACKIYVPDASLSSYQAATNWVTYADYMYPLSTRPCK